VKYGDANIGTCGQTATALKWALLGAGISESRVKTMQVTQFEDRSNPNFDHLNHIHAALVYLDDQPTAFDLWLHGQAKTTFAGYQADGPAAIPLAGWLRKMSADAYLSVRCTEHTELYGFLPTLDPDQWIGKVRTTPLSHRYTDHIPTPRASK
jgi:hypothetical protein